MVVYLPIFDPCFQHRIVKHSKTMVLWYTLKTMVVGIPGSIRYRGHPDPSGTGIHMKMSMLYINIIYIYTYVILMTAAL